MMRQCQVIDMIICVRVFEIILTKQNGQEEEEASCLAAFSKICKWQSPIDQMMIALGKYLDTS